MNKTLIRYVQVSTSKDKIFYIICKMASSKYDPKIHAIGRSVNCYFCGEFVQEKHLQDHVTQCGAVLEPCPNKCGVYIQRKLKEKHILECNAKKSKSSRSPSVYSNYSQSSTSLAEQVTLLQEKLEILKSELDKEKRQKYETKIDLLKSQKYQKSTEEIIKTFENFQQKYFEDTNRNTNTILDLKTYIERLDTQIQILSNWKNQCDTLVQYIRTRSADNEKHILENELTLKNHEAQLTNVVNIDQKINEEQITRQNELYKFYKELNDFQEHFKQDNMTVAALWNDQKEEINDIKQAIEMQLEILNEHKAKYSVLTYEAKALTQTITETEEKLMMQINNTQAIQMSIAQLKLDMETKNQNEKVFLVQDGHFLWRIDKFKEKMNNAKENNTILHSECFYNRKYGYKLRIEAYLNGIKRWKGRHMIVSLQVIKGDWDPLLKWPCNLEARVTLKDQSESKDGEKKQDKVKFITVRRIKADEENEEPQESSTQHIFITHATLEKRQFVKDDCFFLEVYMTTEK